MERVAAIAKIVASARLRVGVGSVVIWIDRAAIRVEIDRNDMQRLMDVADKMRNQAQRLALVPDFEWRQRLFALEHCNGCADGRDHVVARVLA